MKTHHNVGIIMNGVTGRMGLNQHLRRSIYAIMQQGGVAHRRRRGDHAEARPGRPQPAQAGGDLEAECGGLPWTTDLDEALADRRYSVYFDCADHRPPRARRDEGDRGRQAHLLREADVADSLEDALDLYRAGESAPA